MVSKKVFSSILITAVAVFLTMGGSALADEVLEDAKVFIEWNTTDEDQGIQFFWDSEGFTTMTVSTAGGSLVVNTSGNILQQGLTETAIESVEPEASDQTLQDFFLRFPEGIYEFSGKNDDGDTITEITGNAVFTHDLLEPVEFTKVNLPVIEWTEPELNVGDIEPGPPDPATLEVVGYELVVELVVEDEDEEERVFKETTNYPAGFNKHIVGNRFMKLIKNPPGEIVELKVEILVEEPSNNKTITEFVLIEEE